MTGRVRTKEGTVADGTKYLIKAPDDWNGTLLLYSYGPLRRPEQTAWDAETPLIDALLDRGYALAGCGTKRFWPLEENVPNQLALLGTFAAVIAEPEATIAWGQSIGGLMSAALVQAAPESFDGALVLCGTLGGGVATQNQQLDATFAFKTLLAPDSGLQLVNITDREANLQEALSILEQAQATPEGRARIALAAAMATIPGWYDPALPRPADDDHAAQEHAQYEWFRGIDWMVFLGARAVLEQRAGGNISWNTGVDYRHLLDQSGCRDQVNSLYAAAGLDLDADLDALARAPRIAADASAVSYFQRFVTFTGDLGNVPVVTLHTVGDGLVPVNHTRLYGAAVQQAGQDDLLRQLYVDRAGHCTLTSAEVLTALASLRERVELGSWPDLEPAALNDRAAELGPEHNVLPATVGSIELDRGGRPAPPAFRHFVPPPFMRAEDSLAFPARMDGAGVR